MNIYKIKRYDGVFSPAITFTTQTNKVTGVKISCNGSSYSSTDMQVSATVGDTVSMSYSVYGVGTYNTTATWNTGSTESTITVKPTAAGTYTYKATSVGDTSIISPTITLTVTESVVTSVTAVTLTRNGATVSADEQVEVNIGESVTFNYAVIGTGSYNTTAKWSTDNTTSSEKYITFSTAGTYVVYATSVGDSTKVSPKCTIVVKENTGTVSGVTLYKNGVALTENTTVSVIKGSSMTLSYTVSGTGNYNTNAMWQDDSSTTTPRTITFNKVKTYSYRVESVQDNTIYSYTLTVDIKNPVDEVQILKDGTKLTSNTQYTATVGDTISLSYVVAGLSETTTATWSDNGSTTTPRSITYTTAGTYTYKATAVADTSVSSYIVTVVVSAATPTVSSVGISYNGSTLSASTQYTTTVGNTVTLGYVVNGTEGISTVGTWYDNGTATTNTSSSRSITYTTAGTYTYYAVSNADTTKHSYTATVVVTDNKVPVTGITMQYSTNGGSTFNAIPSSTNINVYQNSSLQFKYIISPSNATDATAIWTDKNGQSVGTTQIITADTGTTGTHTYAATSNSDSTISVTVQYTVALTPTVTGVDISYNGTTLTTNKTYNANVGDTVSLGYTVNGTGAISKIAKWRDNNTITTNTSNPRSITFTTAGTYTYDVVVTDAFVSSYTVTIKVTSVTPTVTGLTTTAFVHGVKAATDGGTIIIALATDVNLAATVTGTGSFDNTVTWKVTNANGDVLSTLTDNPSTLTTESSWSVGTYTITCTSNGDTSVTKTMTMIITAS